MKSRSLELTAVCNTKTWLTVMAAEGAFAVTVAAAFLAPILMFPAYKAGIAVAEIVFAWMAIPVMFDAMNGIEHRVAARLNSQQRSK